MVPHNTSYVVRLTDGRPHQQDVRRLMAKTWSTPRAGLYDRVGGHDITNLIVDVPTSRVGGLDSAVRGIFDGLGPEVIPFPFDQAILTQNRHLYFQGDDRPGLLYRACAGLREASASASITSAEFRLQPPIPGKPQQFFMDLRASIDPGVPDSVLGRFLRRRLNQGGGHYLVMDADAIQSTGKVIASSLEPTSSDRDLPDPIADLLDDHGGGPGRDRSEWVLTTAFADRPGLVLDLTYALIVEFQAHVTFSQMHSVGGVMFAHVVFTGSPRTIEIAQCEYRRRLSHLHPLAMGACWPTQERLGHRHSLTFDVIDPLAPTGIPLVLLLAHAKEWGVDVVNLKSWVETAAFSGNALACLSAELDLPGDRAVAATYRQAKDWGDRYFWMSEPIAPNLRPLLPVRPNALIHPRQAWELESGVESLAVCV